MDNAKITVAACIGAGLIGQGWATLFALHCERVILQDTSQVRLNQAIARIEANLDFLKTHALIDGQAAAAAKTRLSTHLDIASAVAEADYVQESVPDNYDIKGPVFETMDAHAPAHTILASSSSGLQISKIQPQLRRPQRSLLVHPLLPVHLVPCVEVVGGAQTEPDTVDRTAAFMKTIGKTPVVLNVEVPGYVVNRLQAALLREAMDLVASGVASAEAVDQAFRLGMGVRDPVLGPLLRAHLAADGIQGFIENYSQSYAYRWEDMATWQKIPSEAAEAVIAGVGEMQIVQQKSLAEIKSWRDEMLVAILKTIGCFKS